MFSNLVGLMLTKGINNHINEILNFNQQQNHYGTLKSTFQKNVAMRYYTQVINT